ncbi:HAD family hydrolase [Erythrobacter sp. F6033]|uniref:HAD family hydrolase n=1 Tax=Erythrobacter sp. F6033 TaxID=2926401 RepID=UPI001FF4D78F|nr:HAD family hydrolase [Erythrobacter sp. F6033]MCK0127083.1 HAD family hydrolase [Erythrobacter sp. F6033]
MSRPLIISDCDEVLLHMVVPFKEWLEESQGINFNLDGANFGEALRWQKSGTLLEANEVWRMLGGFFDTEMSRQTPIAGAVESINALAEHADIVILTNLVDKRRDMRAEQLADHGIQAPVYTNQGPKGPALQKIVEELAPSRAFFIDDLPQHHHSVSEITPDVVRLHMCGEPLVAGAIDCAHKAGHADARIDVWSQALPWLMNKLEETPA